MKQLITPDMATYAEALVMRKTQRSTEYWEDRLSQRLFRDVQDGKLNPRKWLPIELLHELTAPYLLTEADDIQFAMVESEKLSAWNPHWQVPGKIGEKTDKFSGEKIEKRYPCKTALAARLNPEKYKYLQDLR